MAKKKSGKREKLGAVLSELQKLKGEVKTLGKQLAELAVALDKSAPKKAPRGAVRKPAKKAAKPAARKAGSAPKRPVLVSPPSSAAG